MKSLSKKARIRLIMGLQQTAARLAFGVLSAKELEALSKASVGWLLRDLQADGGTAVPASGKAMGLCRSSAYDRVTAYEEYQRRYGKTEQTTRLDPMWTLVGLIKEMEGGTFEQIAARSSMDEEACWALVVGLETAGAVNLERGVYTVDEEFDFVLKRSSDQAASAVCHVLGTALRAADAYLKRAPGHHEEATGGYVAFEMPADPLEARGLMDALLDDVHAAAMKWKKKNDRRKEPSPVRLVEMAVLTAQITGGEE